MARPRKNSEKGRQPTRDLLLEAAEAAFAGHGYGDANLREIASQVGVRHQTLLHYFDSKEGLYIEVLRRMADSIRSHCFPLLENAKETTPEGHLTVLFDAWYDWAEGHRHFAKLISREYLDGIIAPEERVVDFLSLLPETFAAYISRTPGYSHTNRLIPHAHLNLLMGMVSHGVIALSTMAVLDDFDREEFRRVYRDEARRVFLAGVLS